jgi:hypothetical protein
MCIRLGEALVRPFRHLGGSLLRCWGPRLGMCTRGRWILRRCSSVLGLCALASLFCIIRIDWLRGPGIQLALWQLRLFLLFHGVTISRRAHRHILNVLACILSFGSLAGCGVGSACSNGKAKIIYFIWCGRILFSRPCSRLGCYCLGRWALRLFSIFDLWGIRPSIGAPAGTNWWRSVGRV